MKPDELKAAADNELEALLFAVLRERATRRALLPPEPGVLDRVTNWPPGMISSQTFYDFDISVLLRQESCLADKARENWVKRQEHFRMLCWEAYHNANGWPREEYYRHKLSRAAVQARSYFGDNLPPVPDFAPEREAQQ